MICSLNLSLQSLIVNAWQNFNMFQNHSMCAFLPQVLVTKFCGHFQLYLRAGVPSCQCLLYFLLFLFYYYDDLSQAIKINYDIVSFSVANEKVGRLVRSYHVTTT